MPTLKEVAELAGVSVATASLALNHNARIRESTRNKVLACAKAVNYVPNRIGRALKNGKTGAIALLTMTSTRHADIVHETTLLYYLLEGVLSVADWAHYTLRFDVKSHEDPMLLTYFERIIGEGALDGIVIAPQFAGDYRFVELLRRSQFPYVLMHPPRYVDSANYVDMGNYRGGQIVGELMKRCGYRRIAFINGPETHVDAMERERGLLDSLASAGIIEFVKRYGDFTISSGFSAMKSVLRECRPEAVFCGNDYMAAGALKCLHESGLRVPEEVAIVGYDNNDLCVGVVPSLTTVNAHHERVGKLLAKGLLALIDGKVKSVGKTIDPVLVERKSHLRCSPTSAERFNS
ncbi:MAG: LacI family DNA-binding transcriptional regulator [Verrucomicrobia bacterium]|nr:LacI family DNA-binding transcriptional regulator [Verrucomicrobiota bacterium]